MTGWKRALLVLLTIISCVGCDQITKSMAKSHLPKNKILYFAGGTLKLDYAENVGGVLTFEKSLPNEWRGKTFSIGVAVLLGMLILYLLFLSRLRPFPLIALSCMGGGTLSNFVDRTLFGGNVVDFLILTWGGFRTCIFNVADIAITVGLILFALHFLWKMLSLVSEKPLQQTP
jgi:signal peptidase II